ncbi:hypothetical protein OHB41_36155 [Streptomyces sp. NBC_01571]|uniref:hypothetical protein n=1 Tax=Streptomyces sp. NBC_01571 TaxID=2975883 RepID=UPI00225B321E|nr:hypothetical protein [Streptomyces sp. NBC_01571]MCX4578526.1 hypothetical protein [Streptomyces sp. NBC_01571]
MAVDQLPGEVREFACYLDGLMRRLDQGGGWCGVFWQRDPDGMRACLDGWEVPPWDVVEALLQDLGAEYGGGAAAQEAPRARSLHGASLAAFDARPGGRDALGDRLDVMLREQRYAAERRTELNRLLGEAATPQDADSVRLDLAWARDDHERATARCVELRHRMEDLDRRALRTHASGALGFSGAAGGVPRASDGGERGNRAGETWAEGGWAEATGTAPTGTAPTGTAPTGTAPTGTAPTGTAAGHRAAVPGRTGRRSPFADPSAPARPETADPGPYDPSAPVPGPESFTRTGPGVPGASSAPSRPAAAAPAGPGGHGDAFGPGGHGARDDARDAGRPGSGEALAEAGAAVRGDGPGPGAPASGPGHDGYDPGSRPEAASGAVRPHDGPPTPGSGSAAPEPAPAPRQRFRRRPRGSARFAGMMEADAAPVPAPGTPAPLPAGPAAPNRRTSRGARFAGAAEERAEPRTEPRAEPLDGDARRATVETVRTLVRLRAEGRSGEAHAALVEAAYWPAARFPLLAAELHDAGLDADWATLLWEAASLPADRLVAASDALVAAGRTTDGQQMLRQGVGRPAPEIGAAVLGLADEGRSREIRALLDAYVRVRAPEEAARSAESDPARLVPLLLDAARGISEERHWDLVHALRVAGFAA